MNTRIPKGSRSKGTSADVVTASFEPGQLIELVSKATPLPRRHVGGNGKKPSNGKFTSKKRASVRDRRYLRDIEIWLNNCVNFAHRLEAKQGAKILQLLTEVRERTIELRG